MRKKKPKLHGSIGEKKLFQNYDYKQSYPTLNTSATDCFTLAFLTGNSPLGNCGGLVVSKSIKVKTTAFTVSK